MLTGVVLKFYWTSDFNFAIVMSSVGFFYGPEISYPSEIATLFLDRFLPASPKAKAGLGVQSLRSSVRPSVCPSVRPSVRPSVPQSCHRNSSETTDPIIM